MATTGNRKKEKKYDFWHIGAFCFETGMTRIPKIYPSLFCVNDHCAKITKELV
jgi:hypothetical protein